MNMQEIDNTDLSREPALLLEVEIQLTIEKIERYFKELEKREILLRSKAPVTQEYIDKEKKEIFSKVMIALEWLKENYQEIQALKQRIDRYERQAMRIEKQQAGIAQAVR